MSTLDNLLRRHEEGTLSHEELEQLNQLTHRDQVLQAAIQRAGHIRRRRRIGVTSFASIILVAGIFIFTQNSVNDSISDSSTMAQADVPPTTDILTDNDVSLPTTPAQITLKENALPTSSDTHIDTIRPSVRPTPISVTPTHKMEAATIETVIDEIEPSIDGMPETIVACNTQCSPDSVINDIWKFLRT